MRPTNITVGIASAAALLVVAGCGSSTVSGDLGPFDPATTTVELRFTDSSVPPDYHRSYVVTVGGGEVQAVVDSYGDVLHDATEDVPDGQWRSFLDELPAELEGIPRPDSADDGCVGGTSTELRIAERGTNLFNLTADVCDSDRSAQIASQLTGLMKPFTDLVDLPKLTSTG